MAKLTVAASADVPVCSAHPLGTVAEGIRSAKRLSPPEFPLALVVVSLEPGGMIGWDSQHEDEAIYALDGVLSTNSHRCPTGGAIVLESGVPATIRSEAAATFLHATRSSSLSDGLSLIRDHESGTHVLGTGGWYQSHHGKDVSVTWFTDGTCPTCRIALFKVDHLAGFEGELHSHSEDEIIYVLRGSIQLGKREYGPGTAVSIAANTRYRVSYPHGADFLNYRARRSVQRVAGRSEPVEETALAMGGRIVADFR